LKRSDKQHLRERVFEKREESREWFYQLVLEGVKPPTYFGSRRPASTVKVSRLILALLTALGTSIPYIIRGELVAVPITLTIIALIGIVMELFNIRRAGRENLEKLIGFFADLLKNPAVEKWCSPSELIPVCCMLKSGVYVVVELE